MVDATWTLPGGINQNQVASTNRRGVAKFKVTGGGGTYTLTVTGITKAGFDFDEDNSVLTKSITK